MTTSSQKRSVSAIGFAFLLVLLGCASTTQVAPTAPEAKQPKAKPVKAGEWIVSPDQDPLQFRSNEGIRVYLIPIRSKSDPSLRSLFLLRITGSASEYDGLVLLTRRREQGSWVSFVTQMHGAPYGMLMYRKVAAATKEQPKWRLLGYDSGSDHGTVNIHHEAFDAEEVVRLRLEQRDSNIRELETQTRKEVEAAQDARHKLKAEQVSKECGIDIRSSIDWSSVEEEWPEKVSIASKCWPPLQVLGQFCRDYGRGSEQSTRQLNLQCRFESDPSVRVSETDLRGSNDDLVYVPGDSGSFSPPMMSKALEVLGLSDQVLRYGKAFVVVKRDSEGTKVFHGNGKSFSPAAEVSSTRATRFVLPRGARRGELHLASGTWKLRCGATTTVLENLGKSEQEAMLDTATFATEPRWKRTPYFLARDTKGSYYYVDRYKKSLGGGRYRVFIGRQGQIKLSKLKRLVEDSEGTLFSTARGDLRLVVSSGNKSAVWIRGKKVTPLTTIKLHDNYKLIYDDLGVYYGEELDFVCQ